MTDPSRFLAASALAAALAPALPAQAGQPARRPDILVIIADDLGWSDLGCYGGEIPTPHLDALAAGGLRFTRFYGAGNGAATRAELETGLPSHRAGLGRGRADLKKPGYRGQLVPGCAGLAESLAAAGYATCLSGTWPLAKPPGVGPRRQNWPLRRGYRDFEGTMEHAPPHTGAQLMRQNGQAPPSPGPSTTDILADHAAHFIREQDAHDPRQPLYLEVALPSPRAPLLAPAAEIAAQLSHYRAGWDAVRAARIARQRKAGLIAADAVPAKRAAAVPAWSRLPQPRRRQMARRMAVYAAQVHALDRAVGRIVHALRGAGRLDDTLLLFTSDEGPNDAGGRFGVQRGKGAAGSAGVFSTYGSGWAGVSATPFRAGRGSLSEGALRLPLIAHWPHGIVARGELRHDLASAADLLPTCLDAAGAPPLSKRGKVAVASPTGLSLCPAFAGTALPDRTLFFELDTRRATRTADQKLLSSGPEAPWQVFSLGADAGEAVDLAGSVAGGAATAAITAAWQKWAEANRVLPMPPAPPAPGERKLSSIDLRSAKSQGLRRTWRLEPGVTLEPNLAPVVIGRPLTIRATLELGGEGVIVAHGGTVNGYSLFVQDGRLHFATRNDSWLVEAVTEEVPPPGPASVIARLAHDGTLSIEVSGRRIGHKKGPHPILRQPGEGLQVGQDLGEPVGNYDAPFPYTGTIQRVVLEVE